MSETVIRVENLSKQYRLGEITGKTLRDEVNRAWAKLQGKPNPMLKIGQESYKNNGNDESIWALKDVSFEVKQGEVLGIIGRNGAGKSTLLKILSRVTSPTSGFVRLRGRIASLLEVGTGFHPELTGRDNIFLNGAILGMTKDEIGRKFDEIVAFSEIERFIDTPVKRYSSGMYVRLAFAVAAHLEPEILLVDEVLAVGDIAFQKKCLGKMEGVAKEGRTVLFVSHNMGAIGRFCGRAILLSRGQVVADGSASQVTERYQAADLVHAAEWRRPNSAPYPSEFYFLSVRTRNFDREVCSLFQGDQPITIEVEYVVKRRLPECQVIAALENSQGVVVFATGDTDSMGVIGSPREPGKYRGEFLIPGHLLSPGRYTVAVSADLLGHLVYDQIRQVITLEVLATGSAEPTTRRKPGVISPLLAWYIRREEEGM